MSAAISVPQFEEEHPASALSAEVSRNPASHRPSIATVRNLKKSYGSLVALDHVNLDVHAGEVLALLGPNGAGKTTLVRMLLGVARPDAGSVSVFGANPYDGQMQARLGAMLQ